MIWQEVKMALRKVPLTIAKLLSLYVGVIAGTSLCLYGFNLVDYIEAEGPELFAFVLANLIGIFTLSFFWLLTKILTMFLKRLLFKVFTTKRYSFAIGVFFSIIYILLWTSIEAIQIHWEFFGDWFVGVMLFVVFPTLIYIFILCFDCFVVSKNLRLRKMFL